ncbi:MAG: Na+/H+ antiporter subunit E [Chloroflexi bacterium]|nr:Na+/H+ antiporter subunit E [Chloroflexota bacterium]
MIDPAAGWRRPIFRRVAQATALFGLWLALSGELAVEFLAAGALAAVGGVAVSELLFRGTHEGRFTPAPSSVGWLLRSVVRFAAYLPWLAYEIVVANVYVAWLVLHPRLPIDPTLVRFDTTLGSERGQVLLAQSITLTPGTVTVDASNGVFVVHCLSRRSRQGLAEGGIQRKIASIFEETAPAAVVLSDIERPDQVPR